jgi:hypothetical protein
MATELESQEKVIKTMNVYLEDEVKGILTSMKPLEKRVMDLEDKPSHSGSADLESLKAQMKEGQVYLKTKTDHLANEAELTKQTCAHKIDELENLVRSQL